MNGARLRYPLVTGWQTPMSSDPWARMRATTPSMSSTANMTRRMPNVFTGASTGPNLIALGVWNLSSSMPCPSGVRIIARVARTSLSPISLPTKGPSTVVSPSSLRPSSMKNALAASRSSTTMRTLSIRLSVISFLPLNAWRGDRRAGRKVVQRRIALRVTGVRPGAAHDETLVTLGSDIVADRAVASHAAGVRHEYARLAGDVGAEIPGMGGEREQGCVRGRVDVLAPLFRRLGRRLAAVDAVLAHMGDAVGNPFDVLLDRHGHVAKH